MTLETILFLVALIILICAAASKPKLPSFWLNFTLFLIFISAIRLLGADEDIHRYYEIMQVGIEGKVRLSQFFSEILFWFPLINVYQTTGSHIVTFFILDAVWIYILLKSIESLSIEHKLYCALLLLLSFPFFLFYQNAYRQLFATCFFLYAYCIRERNLIKSDLLMVSAVFMHNMIILLYPILLARKIIFINNDTQKYFLFLLATLTLVLALATTITIYPQVLRAGMDTGYDLSLAFIGLFIFSGIYFSFICSHTRKSLFELSPTVIYATALLVTLKLLGFESSIVERTGLSLTVILIIDLAANYPKKNIANEKLYRIALIIAFCIPVYAFHSSRSMLDSSQLRSQKEIIASIMTPINFILISSDLDN